MPILKKAFWDKSGLIKSDYKTYVETGSYRGFMIEKVIDEYDSIHSIALFRCVHNFGARPLYPQSGL